MDLITLEGRFIKALDASYRSYETHPTLAGSDGLIFRCPYCFYSQNGLVNHEVLCWRIAVAAAVPPPYRFQFSGTSLADLTLAPARGGPPPPTLRCTAQPSTDWHINVQNGDAIVPEDLFPPSPEDPNIKVRVFTDWRLSPGEIGILSNGGKIRITTITFGEPLQPVILSVIP